MSERTEGWVDQKCPYCDHILRNHQAVGMPRGTQPIPGAIAMCPGCARTSVFDDELKLRRTTDEELIEFNRSASFREHQQQMRQEWLNRVMASVGIGPSLTVGLDGEVSFEGDLTPEMDEMIDRVVDHLQAMLITEDIKENVTAETAHHVLSVYGNDTATMPSIAVNALISLIRLARTSDDYLLSQLGEVAYIRGYIQAVMMAETPPDGVELLEMIAGLRNVREPKTGKAEQ